MVSVESSPENRSVPQQKIKIEIANIPAYTAELVPLRVNYDFLAGMRPVLVPTKSMAEVMADKILAFPTSLLDNKGDPVELDSRKIRHRDIWDLAWLSQQGTDFSTQMVKDKARDYGIANYRELLVNASSVCRRLCTARRSGRKCPVLSTRKASTRRWPRKIT